MALLNSIMAKPRVRPEEKPVKTTVLVGIAEEKKESTADTSYKKKGSGAKFGLKFEQEINATCNIYREKKLAFIQFFPTPTIFVPKRMKPDGTATGGFMMPTTKTGYDFCGCYKQDGVWKPIYMECKSTERGLIQVWQEKSGIKIHQLNELAFLEKEGLACFILWEVRKANVIYKFTPSWLIDTIGHKTELSITHCDDARLPRMNKMRFEGKDVYDFLRLLD